MYGQSGSRRNCNRPYRRAKSERQSTKPRKSLSRKDRREILETKSTSKQNQSLVELNYSRRLWYNLNANLNCTMSNQKQLPITEASMSRCRAIQRTTSAYLPELDAKLRAEKEAEAKAHRLAATRIEAERKPRIEARRKRLIENLRKEN